MRGQNKARQLAFFIMKRCYRCEETKDLFEFNKDSSRSDLLSPVCRECNKRRNAEYRAKNPDKMKELDKAWYARNREKKIAYTTAWNSNNQDRYLANKMSSKLSNPDKYKQTARSWYEANYDKVLAYNGKRRALRIQAVASWINTDLVSKFYTEAEKMSSETGIKYSVDHIVPLNSSKVCGLHSQHNLQVMPLLENISKGNRIWPDMW